MDAKLIRDLFDYDPNAGVLVWRVKRGNRAAGMVAGCASPSGRWVVSVSGSLQYRYRIGWVHFYGCEPDAEIDHINGDPSDDRIINLRLATRKQNSENIGPRSDNTSGERNVIWDTERMKWKAQIGHNGKVLFGGRFDSFSDAVRSAENLRSKLFTHHRIT